MYVRLMTGGTATIITTTVGIAVLIKLDYTITVVIITGAEKIRVLVDLNHTISIVIETFKIRSNILAAWGTLPNSVNANKHHEEREEKSDLKELHSGFLFLPF